MYRLNVEMFWIQCLAKNALFLPQKIFKLGMTFIDAQCLLTEVVMERKYFVSICNLFIFYKYLCAHLFIFRRDLYYFRQPICSFIV